jgi:hypothetical protein
MINAGDTLCPVVKEGNKRGFVEATKYIIASRHCTTKYAKSERMTNTHVN